MKLKMGANNRITEERFNNIKAATKEIKSVEAIYKKYNIRASTLCSIRRAKNFQEYKRNQQRGSSKSHFVVISPSCGVPYEDYPLLKKKLEEIDKRQDALTEISAFAINAIKIIAVVAMVITIIWLSASMK